ncbi:pilus assembly protein [Oxalobacteraceae bacterium A2-2]
MRGQRGATLLMALLMLVAVMLVGASAALLSLQGEQAARAERDRQVAFQAAEDALADAEHDIAGDGRLDARAAAFSADAALPAACGKDGGSAGGGVADAASRGVLARAESGEPPHWQAVDLGGGDDGGACTAEHGAYTGAAMPTGQGVLPFRRPRYLVERVPCHLPGEDASAVAQPRYCYRVSAIGFGPRPEAEVVLQSVYRKPE